MTETQGTLISKCRNLIGDTNEADYVFSADQVKEWINFAIRDISKHFPRTIQYDISTTADVREYDLETNIISVISVEYPQGEDPPQFLLRRSRTHPSFWIEDGFYDVFIRHDQDSTYPPQLIISTKPADSETIRLEYKGEHNQLSASGDETTLLDRFTPLIPLFVRWKAWQELASSEGMDPDPIKLLSATQEVNAYRAERAYYEALRQALKAETESAVVAGWAMDKHDRVY